MPHILFIHKIKRKKRQKICVVVIPFSDTCYCYFSLIFKKLSHFNPVWQQFPSGVYCFSSCKKCCPFTISAIIRNSVVTRCQKYQIFFRSTTWFIYRYDHIGKMAKMFVTPGRIITNVDKEAICIPGFEVFHSVFKILVGNRCGVVLTTIKVFSIRS